MKPKALALLFSISVCGGPGAAANARDAATTAAGCPAEQEQQPPPLRDLVESAEKSTVGIFLVGRPAAQPNAPPRRMSGGSGVVVASEKVVTCLHVLAPPPGMQVIGVEVIRDEDWFNGGLSAPLHAEPRFQALAPDLAFLDVPGLVAPPGRVGDFSKVRAGDEVFFVGHPTTSNGAFPLDDINVGPAAGTGIVSVIEPMPMQGVPVAQRPPVVRLSAAVNHGNSGGGLFSRVDGTLIGIVNAKAGHLSKFLEESKNINPGARMIMGGVDPFAILQEGLREMESNLQLGIGYAIPISTAPIRK